MTTTLKAAAQQALEALLSFPGDISDEMFESIRSLKAALAEPVQEPGEYHGWVLREVLFDNGEPVGHREPVQEPVLFWHKRDQEDEQFFSPEAMNGHCPDCVPLYAAPPQRKPLTDEEIVSIFRTSGSPTAFARAIEAKHGIGSNT